MSKCRIEIVKGNIHPVIITDDAVIVNDTWLSDTLKSVIDDEKENLQHNMPSHDVSVFNDEQLKCCETRDYLVDIAFSDFDNIELLFNNEPTNALVVLLSGIYDISKQCLASKSEKDKVIEMICECKRILLPAIEEVLVENPHRKEFINMKDLSAAERICNKDFFGELTVKSKIDVKMPLDVNIKEPQFVITYYPESLIEACYILFMNMVENNLTIRECGNCGRYFVKRKGANREYCDRVIPGTDKRCLDVGAKVKYEASCDIIDEIYLREYKKTYNLCILYVKKFSKNKWLKAWNTWKPKADNLKDEAKNKKITIDEFQQKLDKIAVIPLTNRQKNIIRAVEEADLHSMIYDEKKFFTKALKIMDDKYPEDSYEDWEELREAYIDIDFY